MTDPDATPAEKFDAWLAEQEAAGMARRPRATRRQRLRNDAGALVALAGLLAAVWGYGRLAGHW